MTRRLALEPVTAEGFAPFGLLLPRPAPGTGPVELIDALQNGRAAARPRLSLAAVEPSPLPLVATEMERHLHSSQDFLPLDCAAYLVLVAPHGADGRPDEAGLRAFRVPGDVGVHYHADTWHHPLTALDRPGSFAVLTFVDGTAADDEFVPLAEAVTVG